MHIINCSRPSYVMGNVIILEQEINIVLPPSILTPPSPPSLHPPSLSPSPPFSLLPPLPLPPPPSSLHLPPTSLLPRSSSFLPPSFFHPLLSSFPLFFLDYRFKIISEKEKGVISGWQVEPNGKIIYMKTLPRDTQISL